MVINFKLSPELMIFATLYWLYNKVCGKKYLKRSMVVRIPEWKIKRKGGLTTMARDHNNGTTILLGVKDLKIVEVTE